MTISTCSAFNLLYYKQRRLLTFFFFLLSSFLLVATVSAGSSMPPLRQTDSPVMTALQRRNISSVSTPRGGSSTIDSNNDRQGRKNNVPSTSIANNTTWRAKVRSVLFPIYGTDVKKFFLVGSIKFFVILALTLTRDNKDTMVVTECGAEAIAFLKVSF